MNLRRALRVASLRVQGVSVTALVGASGSGKSFRAGLIAKRRSFRILIDDGMIIRESTILTGQWSKKEHYLQAAVRRALFEERGQAVEARAILRREHARTILIVGTSPRMVRRICRTLWLPAPAKVIRIEDITQPIEIRKAVRRRHDRHAHSSPVPLVTVRKKGLRGLLARLAPGLSPVPTRIVPPAAGNRGGVIVTEQALALMALHCLDEYAPGTTITKLIARESAGMYVISLHVRPPRETDAGSLHALRDSLLHALERQAGLIIRRLDIIVDSVGSTP